eukprot:609540-Hanusia_phi.AAC.1
MNDGGGIAADHDSGEKVERKWAGDIKTTSIAVWDQEDRRMLWKSLCNSQTFRQLQGLHACKSFAGKDLALAIACRSLFSPSDMSKTAYAQIHTARFGKADEDVAPLTFVKPLTDLCLLSAAIHFKNRPTFAGIPEKFKENLCKLIPTDLPLQVSAPLIESDVSCSTLPASS